MAKTCNKCQTENANVTVPYVVHEATQARSERHNKRLWIIILALIVALIGTNLAWIGYNSQFETVEETNTTVEQDADNGTNNFIGGNLYGEAENNNN